ncbi:SRPBCC family protein [Acidipropionibacterium thoenii]|uniref:SRPBCC family protein n=1 Tax=Acidipropionibacterium thoenii TaxID=1751 RepID=UPI000416395A|nr:SRPBCC family protein [Acidipropionibacterium thoenii]
MSVTDVTIDENNLTVTVIADLAHPVERVWQLYTDPRRLERVWGPPGAPATFTEWDFRQGGRALYYMTGTRDERYWGRWDILDIDPGHSFQVLDSFADEHGEPSTALPASRMSFVLEPAANGPRFTLTTTFETLDDFKKIAQEMEMTEGLTQAMGQADAVLDGLRQTYQGRVAHLEVLSDTWVKITRAIEAPRTLIWRAYNDPEMIRRWMLGPDGWVMSECKVAREVGQTFRYVWTTDPAVPRQQGESFGLEGELLLRQVPFRAVTTERMLGTEGPETVNDLTLVEEDGITLVTTVIEYPDAQTRDMILGTGMIEGMEHSYARLERSLLAEPV